MTIRTPIFNKVFLLFVIVAGVAAAFVLWQRGVRGVAERRYKTEALEIGDVTKTVSANGTLNPVVLVNVGTQVSGTVKKLHADYNDHVRAGQVLLELDPALFMAQVKHSEANVSDAQAELELAKANEARSRILCEREFISKQDFDQATQSLKSSAARLDLARAQLAKDQTNLAYTVIRSPVSGVVVDRAVDVGQTVAASFQTPTLFRIAQDLRKMQIDSNFAEADIGNIKVGQPVRFTVDAFPERSFDAAVRQIRLNPITQQNVVTYDVVVAVDNPEQILMPGMTAYVNVIVAERKNVRLVPNAALRFKPRAPQEKGPPSKSKPDAEDGAARTVYVLQDNQLQPVAIRVGISDNRFAEVLSGNLKAGDRVVASEEGGGTETRESGTLRIRLF
jgi:HlyD family secretion protein